MREIKVKKKSEIEQKREDERRTELAMLKLLSNKYPTEAKKFASGKILIDSKIALC